MIKLLNQTGFIALCELKEGHIAPYNTIEFQIRKIQTYVPLIILL